MLNTKDVPNKAPFWYVPLRLPYSARVQGKWYCYSSSRVELLSNDKLCTGAYWSGGKKDKCVFPWKGSLSAVNCRSSFWLNLLFPMHRDTPIWSLHFCWTGFRGFKFPLQTSPFKYCVIGHDSGTAPPSSGNLTLWQLILCCWWTSSSAASKKKNYPTTAQIWNAQHSCGDISILWGTDDL